MKLCIITCYNQPDYIRARTLRAAARAIDGVEVIVVKNKRTGILRYPEVFVRTLLVRFRLRPDVYLLTFRGYEMLLPVRLVTIGKSFIYDEFIHPIEWAIYEHKKLAPKDPLVDIFRWLYRLLVRMVGLVITDTNSHADLSARLTGIKRQKIISIPVGTDDTVFKQQVKQKTKNKLFNVFYYGNMLPLHGLEYVVEAALKLKNEKVTFVLVGGTEATEKDVIAAQKAGANIDYKKWVEFDELPKLMNTADLCLAGPFGGTYQADYVITGKAFQYLAMARPIVVGANKESHVFTNKKNALITEQKDGDALAETVRWAMSHSKDLDKIGLAGQRLYKEQYSAKRLAIELKGILSSFTNF